MLDYKYSYISPKIQKSNRKKPFSSRLSQSQPRFQQNHHALTPNMTIHLRAMPTRLPSIVLLNIEINKISEICPMIKCYFRIMIAASLPARGQRVPAHYWVFRTADRGRLSSASQQRACWWAAATIVATSSAWSSRRPRVSNCMWRPTRALHCSLHCARASRI